MEHYYSSGKLLISGEYLVLKGAEALAVATSYGQKMQVEHIENNKKELIWEALLADGSIWFKAVIDLIQFTVTDSTDDTKAQKLLRLIQSAYQLNPQFIRSSSYRIKTELEFDKNWGLGSSSSLICNIAKWAEVDAFELSAKSFGGSGYDIAVGMVGSDLLYSVPPAWIVLYGIPLSKKDYISYTSTENRIVVKRLNVWMIIE